MDILGFLRRKKLKQADLARALDTSPGNVARWVNDEGVPSWELCRKMKLLGINDRELFGIDEQPNTNIESEVQKMLDTPECREAIAQALLDIKNRGSV